MTGDASLEAQLTDIASTIESPMSHTIVPPGLDVSAAARGALHSLAQHRTVTPSALPRQLEIGDTLGEGGMGIVRVGTQTILGREVAVKSPRADSPNEVQLQRLMQEAWVTGALEHPNIVPVHDVLIDADGRPHILLKKVSGTTWDVLIQSDDELRKRFDVADALEWHLRVFLQVCNAMHFAHSRGVVHRDIKPENVMVGEFGEVYLVDWGIAVSLEDDPSGRLPLAKEATKLAGTPSYMAPEMLGESPPRIGPHTDVYLLGATLYEVLAREPPHNGPTALAVLTSVATSKPVAPPSCPEELWEILRRAMRREPEDRFAGVEDLRAAVEAFLRHRGSSSLSADAAAKLDSLAAALADPEGADRQALYNAFGACQFGFRAALDSWPDNAAATRGLRDATESMARYELSMNEPRAAHALIAQLDAPDEELLAEIESRSRELADDAAETRVLAEAGRQMDARVGAGTRGVVAFVLGVAWISTPVIRLVIFGDGPLQAWEQITFNLLLGLLAGGFFLWKKAVVLATRYNRVGFGAVFVLLTTQLGVGVAAMMRGDPTISTELLFVTTTAFCAMVALMIDRRLWFLAAAWGLGWLGTVQWPDAYLLFASLANVVLVVTLVVIWRRGTAVPV